MANSDYNKGQSDKNNNMGQKDPNSFKNDKERKDYQAGWNNTKQGKK
jgi:hypothetical protein